jgi:hypothetical protein
MDTDPGNLERIARLENELHAAKNQSQKYIQELETLRQEYADNLFEERQITKRLQEERLKLQRDYTQLRVQKGGFGIKVLVLSGFAGFLTGLLLCALYFFLFKPKNQHSVLFEQFRDKHQFNIVRAISTGDFESAEQSLEESLNVKENKQIRPEIEFAKKIVGAAKRRCE